MRVLSCPVVCCFFLFRVQMFGGNTYASFQRDEAYVMQKRQEKNIERFNEDIVNLKSIQKRLDEIQQFMEKQVNIDLINGLVTPDILAQGGKEQECYLEKFQDLNNEAVKLGEEYEVLFEKNKSEHESLIRDGKATSQAWQRAGKAYSVVNTLSRAMCVESARLDGELSERMNRE